MFIRMNFLTFFFFFSSRRRHTRCYRDWSSDVCSSDLDPGPTERVACRTLVGDAGQRVQGFLGTLRTELVLEALEMALHTRRPAAGLIHHSDRGCQYTSFAFGRRCREARVAPSMGSVGDAFDNALAESFFATLECELIDLRSFRNCTEARLAVFAFIEGFYNPHRRHSSLGQLSPAEFERRWSQ